MDTSWSQSPHWGTFWGQFQIELVGGTISGCFFLFLALWLFKPKVNMPNFFCHVKLNDNSSYFSFKFVNMSFFSAHEIKIELHKLRKIPMGSGEFNNEHKQLSLVSSQISHVPSRPFFWIKDKSNAHCFLVRSLENLNDILTEEQSAIVIKISLKHGLTGLSNVFEQEYANIEDIKIGKFKPGTKFGII